MAANGVVDGPGRCHCEVRFDSSCSLTLFAFDHTCASVDHNNAAVLPEESRSDDGTKLTSSLTRKSIDCITTWVFSQGSCQIIINVVINTNRP